MPSIFISGIPKGLDRRIVSLRIRKDIETVAQVKTIEIQKEKGYGFVSLLDETSADFVLSLNKKICINGNPLSIRRWRIKSGFPNTSRRTAFPLCMEEVNNDVFVLRGYDTYTNYKRHRPQTDVLYQYIQQSPKQKQVKRKSWKDINRLSQQPSPKSRKTVRTKKRKSKKTTRRYSNIKPSTSSSKEGLHFVSDGQKRLKFHSACENECLSNTLRSSKKVTRTKMINDNALESNHSIPSATVHVYDHSKRVCSIEVDNNNLLESIRAGLKNKIKMPSDDTVLISHNGKTVNSQWQPKMENDDNIHIVVKGKGGMMQSDTPDESDGNNKNKKKKRPKVDCRNEGNDSEASGYSANQSDKDLDEGKQKSHLHQILPVASFDQSLAQVTMAGPGLDKDKPAAAMLKQMKVQSMPTHTTAFPTGTSWNLPHDYHQVFVDKESGQSLEQNRTKSYSKETCQPCMSLESTSKLVG